MRSIVIACALAVVAILAVAMPVFDRVRQTGSTDADIALASDRTLPSASPASTAPRPIASVPSPFVRVANPVAGESVDRVLLERGTTAGRLFATIPSRTQVFRSDDGGRNWRTLLTPAGSSAHIALVGETLVLADGGHASQALGRTGPASISRSRDHGETWQRAVGVDAESRSLLDSVVDVYGWDVRSPGVFLAASIPQPTYGAATPTTEILGSLDGLTWKRLGQMPGPAVFGAAADAPLVSFIKNNPADGLQRVEGRTLDSLRLAAVKGSVQAWSLYRDPATSDLWQWSIGDNPVRRSIDDGLHWLLANAGDSHAIAGFFNWGGTVFAFTYGPGIRRWDGTRWQVETWSIPEFRGAAEADGFVVAWAADGSVWRATSIWLPSVPR